MPDQEIAQLGHPILRKQSQIVENICAEETINIVEHMLDILAKSKGVGLAAPQIFISIRLIIIASKASSRYPNAPTMHPIVMFNPEFKALSEATESDWEGCLSIPGVRALVPRYKKINIIYWDRQGKKQKFLANDFIARIFQHEYDHLNGLVYLDRIKCTGDIVAESEYKKIVFDKKTT